MEPPTDACSLRALMEPVRKGNQRREEGMDGWRSKNKPEKKAAEDVEPSSLMRGYKRRDVFQLNAHHHFCRT